MSDNFTWNDHLQQIVSNPNNTTQSSPSRNNSSEERPNFGNQIEQRGNNARFSSEPVNKSFNSHIEFSTKKDD